MKGELEGVGFATWMRASSAADVHKELGSFLRRAGWAPTPGGAAGELWTHPTAAALAIPYELHSSDAEFLAIIRRVAELQRRTAHEVALAVVGEYLDVQNFRIADRFVLDGSVSLESAATMLTSARRLIRAAATTARRPKPQIGSNYSAPGDAIAAKARLSHTRDGSFVMPVVMPVDPPTPGEDELFQNEHSIEPGERRVTRTLATALAALDSIAIRPGQEPNADGLYELVQRGVSREMVAAVRAIAVDYGVHAFDVSFSWAPGLDSPGRIPDRVLIPSDASPLLVRLEERLAAAPPDENQTISGLIAEIRFIDGEPTGELAIRTVRSNRLVEVRMAVSSSIILNSYDWAKQHRAIIARGAITTSGGRLFMPEPESVAPIDELFVVTDDLE